MKRLLASVLLCCVLLSSCATTSQVSLQDDISRHFLGLKHNEIVMAMGAPTRETSDGATGKILIYEEVIPRDYSAANANYIVRTYSPTVTGTQSYVQFYIDKDNTCYNVITNYTKSVKTDNNQSVGVIILECLLGAVLGGLVGLGIAALAY